MTHDLDLDAVIRQRIRGLRLARGWSLDALAARCYLSPSTLSRIETGHRRIALDQLVPIARALDTTLDHLVEAVADDDVVIRPEPRQVAGVTTWLMSRESTVRGVTVAKMRFSPEHPSGPAHQAVHPGREWFTVLSGTVRLHLGDRVVLVEPGDAAEFSTMVPHSLGAVDGPAEILTIFDQDGERAHIPVPGRGRADDGRADDGRADDGSADDGSADDGRADAGEDPPAAGTPGAPD